MGIVAAVTVIVIVLTGIVPVNTLIPAFESVSHSSLSLSNFLSNLCRSNLVVLTGSVVLTSLALTSFVPASLVLGRLESLSLPSLEPLSCPESTSPGVLAHGLFLPLLLYGALPNTDVLQILPCVLVLPSPNGRYKLLKMHIP